MPLTPPASPIADLLHRYEQGATDPLTELDRALARSNSTAGHNVYLAQDPAWSQSEARRLDPARLDPAGIHAQPLWGIPVSLKDCFDLDGFRTSAGARFYLQHNATAAQDSTVAARLRSAGAIITGKTHLHQIAYGITGENADFGDCLQPQHPQLLTGGSSSGAAASVQEGSALAAIGTDTGGSIRVPAALCGLCGYRSSITMNASTMNTSTMNTSTIHKSGGPVRDDLWQGGAHLAPSFDTIGWLYNAPADGPRLGNALFGLPQPAPPTLQSLRIGVPSADFLHDCDPAILTALDHVTDRLRERGINILRFDATLWNEALDIITPIQASEAAALHRGHFDHLEPAIAHRLAWGAAIPASELATLHQRMDTVRTRTYNLFQHFDYLLTPCAPMTSLRAGADHTATRPRILRYTAPISLTGLPVVALPMAVPEGSAGLQLVAPLNADATLLALSTTLS
jgi:Asp-tRNA(Asn)/Glu-tRNA(Gln) amidotransferase A subunit family amidase